MKIFYKRIVGVGRGEGWCVVLVVVCYADTREGWVMTRIRYVKRKKFLPQVTTKNK